ncbi:MAG: alpha/beta hydrolase, partial [Mycoplasma sp.]|nr:alpha/beta hydrolase [Mycoplasma sp.]
IIALNLPGSKHSINQYSKPLSIELFIEHTRTFIDQFIKRKVVLVGHSLGGGVVSALSDHPKVEKVVYINTIHPFIYKSRLYQFIYKYYSKKTAWQQIKNAVINGAMTVYKNKIAKEEEKEIIETMLDQNKPEHNIVQQNLFNENFVQHTLKINYFKSLAKDPVFIIGSSDIVIEPMHFIEFVKNELKRDFILLENVVHSPFLFNCE